MATILVIAFSGGSERDSYDIPDYRGDALVSVTPKASRSAHCASARKAVRFYQRRHHEWKLKTGAVGEGSRSKLTARPSGCPRYYAKYWKAKAAEAKKAYHAWFDFNYAWWKWLPDKWARIGACETGYGKRPGRWTWNSGTYQGAFGFYFGTWDAYKPKGAPSEAYLATPRQQYQCALNVAAAHGYGAWGCGGA